MSRLAVVTGGNTGIGRYLVTALAGAGYDVAFSWIDRPEMADSLVAEVEACGRRGFGRKCDVGQEADVVSFYDAVVEWAGTAPHLLVNNAGVQTWGPLLETTSDDWDMVLRTNVKGAFLNTREAGKKMIAGGIAGSIVNIGSGCNKLAFANLVAYTASKGGIEQFTKVSAVELGRYGIRVNCVAPGAILNERTAAETGDYAGSWGAITPLGRVGTVEDIAGPVLFFASDAAGFVTGQTLWVDGGVFTQANFPRY
ncbi:SDR family oxidoreductase [Aureimonas altamirensis]|uniref:SDR family NAD(P)-dependent oxidoreductase n=1 Tax=Aureimonas altamirensis TaxID=370622 RepID=UPI0020368B35|nr:SDR family NAD(P)-dependent oxidoreductase [Aureimonas altamirensis]MCM2504417.1 SDR family oxidoreductase [Aureimonas altamirensis]